MERHLQDVRNDDCTRAHNLYIKLFKIQKILANIRIINVGSKYVLSTYLLHKEKFHLVHVLISTSTCIKSQVHGKYMIKKSSTR